MQLQSKKKTYSMHASAIDKLDKLSAMTHLKKSAILSLLIKYSDEGTIQKLVEKETEAYDIK